MRTTLLFILGLTILAVAVAPKPKKAARDIEKSEGEEKKENATGENNGSEPTEETAKGKETSKDKKSKPKSKPTKENSDDENKETAQPARKSKKDSKPEPAAKKPSKKAPKKEEEEDDDDDDTSEDLEDVLQDDDEENEDELEIPSLDELTTESDPIKLAEKIKGLTDKTKKKELKAELRQAWQDNKGTLPGRFYQAAYAALLKVKGAEKLAEKFWNKELDKATNKVKETGKDIIGKTQAGLGNAFGNASKLAEIDPVGIALRRGEAVLLTALSDSLKHLGKITDFTTNAVKNGSRLIRAATFPVDLIPIAREVKNNVHDYIEEQADRGNYLLGSFADNGSAAFANASKDADKKAERKETLLREFTSRRAL